MRNLLASFLLLFAVSAHADDGLETIQSDFGVKQTVDRLTSILEKNGFTLFTTVHHAAGALKVGMKLKPTQLIIFGKPKVGTVLMQSNRTVGIDLPLKYLVWKTEDGKVNITWNKPAYLLNRHNIDNPRIQNKMTGALANMAKTAATK